MNGNSPLNKFAYSSSKILILFHVNRKKMQPCTQNRTKSSLMPEVSERYLVATCGDVLEGGWGKDPLERFPVAQVSL